MTPPAPPRFSITTGCPRLSASAGTKLRAVMSVPPPGAAGTIRRIGLAGYCAHAWAAVTSETTMSAMSFVTSTSSLRYPQSTARAMVLDLQPALRRLCHGFRARANAELPEERLDMELDRVERDVEAPRDRLVRQAFGDRAQHLDLARREEHAPLGLRQRGETDACFLHDHVRRLRRFHHFMAGRDDHGAH